MLTPQRLNIVETGFMYDSNFTLPLGSDEANFGPIDVKWSFKISQISAGFLNELLSTFNSVIEELLVHLRFVNSLIIFHIAFGLPVLSSTSVL